MKLAIFDFDGTLYKNETFPLLMSHLKEHPVYGRRYKRFYRSILLPYIAYKLKLYPAEKMKFQMMQRYLHTFRGLHTDELDEYFSEIAHKMKEDLHAEVIARLKAHKENKIHIMIVSGAFSPLLKAITKELPIDTIIGTKIPLQDDFYDDKTPIDHVHAERKTELIQQQLQDQTIDWKNSYAYGDSYSDLSVLKLVGNPIVVAPDEKLHAVATKNNWEVIK